MINNKEEDYSNDIFNKSEFVMMRSIDDDGQSKFISGGYKVNSYFLENGIPPLTTMNNESQEGGKISSPFENLAVPAGLFYINQRVPKYEDDKKEKDHYYQNHETISDDMIDKLFGLVESNKKQNRKTRKHTNKSDKKKSRKHR
jgi:hypothetical protein